MLQPDLQRLSHIRDYCVEIEKTIIRYGSMSRDIIWETATVDIPMLKAFCQEQLDAATG